MSHGGSYKFDQVFQDYPVLVEVDASRFDVRAVSEITIAS